MNKYFCTILLFFTLCPMFSQDFYTFLSPVGWESEMNLLNRIENDYSKIEEFISISDNVLSITFPQDLYSIQNTNGNILVLGPYNFLLSENDIIIVNNQIEIDLSSNLVLFVSISEKTNIENYAFPQRNRILFPSEIGENIFSPFQTSILKKSNSENRTPTIFINIKGFEMVLGGLSLDGNSIERFNKGDILGKSKGNSIPIFFHSAPSVEKKIFLIYIQENME